MNISSFARLCHGFFVTVRSCQCAAKSVLTAVGLTAMVVTQGALAQAGVGPKATADAWRGIVAAAQKEGRVILYSSQPVPVQSRLKADFEKAGYGLVLENSRYPGAELISKLEQEKNTGADGADVVITTEIPYTEGRALDGSIKSPVGPASAAWPAVYTVRAGTPVVGLEPIGMAYNTNLVKTPFTSYQDLLRPEFKGRFGILDLTATTVFAFYDWLEKTEGGDFLAKLAAQQPRLYVSVPSGLQSVAAGELAIGSFINPGFALPLVKQGAPVRIVMPRQVLGFGYAAGVLSGAKRPNAAQVFMDYLLSPRGQTIWHGNGDSASPLPNIPNSLDAKTIHRYDPAPYTQEWMNSYKTRWNALFKR